MTDDHTPHVDAHTGTATTGHEWDGIRELNTPLPQWWLTILYGTIIWAFLYVIAYPAIPLWQSYTTGVLGWSSRGAVNDDVAALRAQRGPMVAKLAAASLSDIEKDPQMRSFAIAEGKAAFANNCAPCHGAGAGGSKGYPNLNDDDWLWGGTLEQISATITHGIRSADPDAHAGNMPAFGRDGIIKADEISTVADYVRSLSGLETAKGADLTKGAKIFADNCAACHGDNGKGNMELGAPNLTDAIWLYGPEKATIVEGLVNGRGGVMPAWKDRLEATTIKALTVYVHTLGGGQ
jgi:cytochrome c oxidase cbb3-type subunit III